MTKEKFINSLPVHIHILGEYQTRKVYVNGLLLKPEESLKVRNHNPDGFAWGYGGSGPAQLALAILMMFANPATAIQHYQDFKFGYIAGLPQKDISVHINLQWVMKTILQVGAFGTKKYFHYE